MNIVYALEDPPDTYERAVFLAGPTPRGPEARSWRPEAISIFDRLRFDGIIFVPEDRSGVFHGDYNRQVEWEDRCLELADAILFWVPRKLPHMPALTTNIEFGRWERSGKTTFGVPSEAAKNNYPRHYAELRRMPSADRLDHLVELTVDFIGEGEPRTGGEREVPLAV